MAERYTAANLPLRDWVLRELRQRHVGAANAVTWQVLGEKARGAGYTVSRDERQLREEVNALQATGGECALIVATSGIAANGDSPAIPPGVFIAETMAEVDACRAQLISRIAALRERADRMNRAAQALLRARVAQPRLL